MPAIILPSPATPPLSIRIRTPQAEGLRRALAARGLPTTHSGDLITVAGADVEAITRLAFERDAVVHEIGVA
jgi:hypothetical protein